MTPKAASDTGRSALSVRWAFPEALASAQATLGAQLVTLYTFLAVCCAVMIFKDHSDPRQMASLGARKVVFQSANKSGKKAEEMDRSEWLALEEVERPSVGCCFRGSNKVYGSSTPM